MGKYRLLSELITRNIVPSQVTEFSVNLKKDIYSISIKIINDEPKNEFFESIEKIKLDSMIEYSDEENEFEKVISIFYQEVESFVEMISYCSALPVYEHRLIKCYEATDGINEFRIKQYGYNLLDKIISKPINLKNFNTLIQSVNQIDSKYRKRLQRAIHWYSKVLNEKDCLDRFTYMWIGFESLVPLFEGEFSVDEISKCKECGFEKVLNNKGSLKNFFDVILDKADLYSRARKLRNQLQHSFELVSKVERNVLDIEDELMECFRKLILHFIDIKPKMIGHPLIANSEDLIIEADLKLGLKPNTTVSDINPNITISCDFERLNNNIVIHPKFSIDFQFYTVISLGFNVYGNPGHNVKFAQVTLSG